MSSTDLIFMQQEVNGLYFWLKWLICQSSKVLGELRHFLGLLNQAQNHKISQFQNGISWLPDGQFFCFKYYKARILGVDVGYGKIVGPMKC